MTLVELREAAVGAIQAAFAGKLYVASHPGAFNEAEIRRLSNRTPAILTSLMRYESGSKCGIATLVSWVLYRAGGTDKLYDGALQILSSLIPVIKNIDLDFAITDFSIESECLFSGSLDAINVTLWAVKWGLRIDRDALDGASLASLENFEGYDAATLTGERSVADVVNMGLEG